jgi:hypothetical protein
MLEAQSEKLQGSGDAVPERRQEEGTPEEGKIYLLTASARREFAALSLQHDSEVSRG